MATAADLGRGTQPLKAVAATVLPVRAMSNAKSTNNFNSRAILLMEALSTSTNTERSSYGRFHAHNT